MRKFFVAVLVAFLGFAPAHADKMVNVEYIHKLIEQRWDIKIPYSPKLSTPKVAANMKYLLTLVDMTNKRINGTATTHYGDGEFATMAAADTVAANRAIKKLVKIKPKFFITTTPDTETFEFRMSAKGRFMVDWGDNTVTQIVRKNMGMETYTHQYEKPGEYKISIGGLATGYNTNGQSAINFNENKNTAGINGSLGAIFPTIGDGDAPGQQPSFSGLFYSNSNLVGPIPKNLFAGIHGAPIGGMFYGVFFSCGKLSGSIPNGLFGGLSGKPAANMFYFAFYNCVNLTGEIPADLFGNLSGEPASAMFVATFALCYRLSGEIPAGLFGNLYGAPADRMFYQTFWGCGGLSGKIPAGLFGNLEGQPAGSMFFGTFSGCKGLDGPIPAGLFGKIYGQPAGWMYQNTFQNCSGLTGEIPAGLFGDIYGEPRERMFAGTFDGCSNLTGEIPSGLFGDISGPAKDQMFSGTFHNCTNLTGCVPDGLFGDVDMTLDEIIAEYKPLSGSGITPQYCPVDTASE